MKRSEITFKHWSFVFFITAICLNILITILVIKTTVFYSFDIPIIVFSVMAFAFTLFGIILGLLSKGKNEQPDYKQIIGLYGNIGLLGLGLFSLIF